MWPFKRKRLAKADHLAYIRHLAERTAFEIRLYRVRTSQADNLDARASKEVRKAAKWGYGDEAAQAYRDGVDYIYENYKTKVIKD